MQLGKPCDLIIFDNNPIPHYQWLCSDIVKDLIKKKEMVKTKRTESQKCNYLLSNWLYAYVQNFWFKILKPE